jgi:DNA repair exonuclease SbcCD nuclease subunit
MMMKNMIKINKPRIGIVSDLHLGVHTNSTQWHEIAITWANWLVSEFKRQNIKDIVFCGDWHHNRSEISVNTLQISADILDIFKEFNLVAITGNHDVYYKHRTDVNSLSIFKNRDNVTIFNKVVTFTAFDRVITLCPWNTSVSEIPKSDVIFGHFEIETFKMNSYKVCEEGMRIKDLLQRSNLVISGHFHIRHEKKFGAGTILYVGNPFQMDFGDTGNYKGYYILDLDTLEYEFTENTVSPHYIKISLSELVSYETITPELRNLFTNNIVKLKIDRNISQEDLITLTTKLNQLRSQNLSIDYDINYNKITNGIREKDLSGIDISEAIEEFVNLLEIENKKDVLDYTIDLYSKCIL